MAVLKVDRFMQDQAYQERNAQQPSDYIGWVKAGIVIAEIGLSLIPGANIATLGIRPLYFAIGVGIAGATANTIADATMTGQVSPWGIAFDFATAFLPLATAMIHARKVDRIIAAVDEKVQTTAYRELLAPAIDEITETTKNSFHFAKHGFKTSDEADLLMNIARQKNIELSRDFVSKSRYDIKRIRGMNEYSRKRLGVNRQKLRNGAIDLKRLDAEQNQLLRVAKAHPTTKVSLKHKTIYFKPVMKKQLKNFKQKNSMYRSKFKHYDGNAILRRDLYAESQARIKFAVDNPELVSMLSDKSKIRRVVARQQTSRRMSVKGILIRRSERIKKLESRLTAARRKYGMSLSEIHDAVTQARSSVAAISKLGFHDKINKTTFMKRVSGLAPESAQDLFKRMYSTSRLENVMTQKLSQMRLERKRVFNDLNNNYNALLLANRLSSDGVEKTTVMMNRIMYRPTNNKDIKTMFDTMANTLSSNDLQVFSEITGTNSWDEVLRILSPQNAASTWTQRWKYLGSKDFNRKFVQRIQLLDPRDLGRTFSEKGYQKAKEWFRKKSLDFKLADSTQKVMVGIVSNLDKYDEFEEAYIAAGGTIAGGGRRYLMGFKVLDTKGKDNVVLLTFNKENTGADDEKSKNHGGKKDVLILASHEDLDGLRKWGAHYYWEVGKAKGWYRSRGGRAVNKLLARDVSPHLSLFLNLAHMPAVRNMLSATSNVVEVMNDVSRDVYFQKYTDRLIGSFTKTAVTRSMRFVTREVIPTSIAKKHLTKTSGAISTNLSGNQIMIDGTQVSRSRISRFLFGDQRFGVNGEIARLAIRESGKYTSALAAGMLRYDNQGKLRFNTRDFGRRTIKKYTLGTMKPNILRYARRKDKGNLVVAKFGDKRSASQLGRIYGAVTPSGRVKPLKALGRMKIRK